MDREFLGDTSPEAAAVQAGIQRSLTGSQRLRIALDMSQFARELALSRLRLEHPDWSEVDLKRELLRYAFLPAPLPLGLERQWDAACRAAEARDDPR